MALTDKKLGRIGKMLSILALSFGLLGGSVAFCWNSFARPDIDKRIDEKQRPIIEMMSSLQKSVEHQKYLLIETMDSSAVNRADRKFKRFYIKKN